MPDSLEGFIQKFETNNLLRRRSVGVLRSALGSYRQVGDHLHSVVGSSLERIDLLERVSTSKVNTLTATRLYDSCIPSAASQTRSPRLIFGFDPLFSILSRQAQETVSSRLSHAEPLDPFVILIHSPYTEDRLRNDFSQVRIFEWTA